MQRFIRIASPDFPISGKTLSQSQISNRYLHHFILRRDFEIFEIDGQTSLNRFVNIFEEFVKCLALGRTAFKGWHFCPVPAFFCFVNNDFEFHIIPSFFEERYLRPLA